MKKPVKGKINRKKSFAKGMSSILPKGHTNHQGKKVLKTPGIGRYWEAVGKDLDRSMNKMRSETSSRNRKRIDEKLSRQIPLALDG